MNDVEKKWELIHEYLDYCHIHTFVKRFQCGCGDRILKEFNNQ